jgi:proline iminopeptidase
MPYIIHPLGKTHFTKKGKKTKKPALIVCHGGPGGTHNPNSPVFDLATDRQVFAYTQIGGGKSSALKPSQMKIKTFVEELTYLIDSWEIDSFHLMGGSWGTTLILEYALKTRDKRIKSLLFQSPMFSASQWKQDADKLIKGLSKADQKVIKYCLEIKATDSKVFKKAMERFYLKHVLRNKEALKKLMNSNNPNGAKVYKRMWGESEFSPTGTLKNYNRVKHLQKLNVPCLYLAGQYDEATPKSTKKFAKLTPNSKFQIIKNGSHALWIEKPNELKKAVSRFINSVEA